MEVFPSLRNAVAFNCRTRRLVAGRKRGRRMGRRRINRRDGGEKRHLYEYSLYVGTAVLCILTSQGVNMTLAQKPTVQRVREPN